MDTPAWKEFPRTIITKKLIDKFGQEKAQRVHNFFVDYLNDAVPMWDSPVQGFATDTLAAAFGEVLAKTKQPKEALQEAQKVVQAKLEETLKGAAS
jgi:ABC-type glycerol-3-phosphate transport system substrate-binding protein